MNISDLQTAAASLYDGGWRAEDREQIKSEYGFTDGESDELDEICRLLEEFEKKQLKDLTVPTMGRSFFMF